MKPNFLNSSAYRFHSLMKTTNWELRRNVSLIPRDRFKVRIKSFVRILVWINQLIKFPCILSRRSEFQARNNRFRLTRFSSAPFSLICHLIKNISARNKAM